MKTLRVTVNGRSYDVQVEEINGSAPPAAAPALSVAPAAPVPATAAPDPETPAAPAAPAPAPVAGSETVSAPMPGTILSVNVEPGKSVKAGDVLLILEAMKMENEIMAGHEGVIASVLVNKGDAVDTGTPLVSYQ